MISFDRDYQLLKNMTVNSDIFCLSGQLSPEILKGGIDRYIELYPYFWKLIDDSGKKCYKDKNTSCYNQYFFTKLRSAQLSENDLYILTYMTTYFLDLIISLGNDLVTSYYILSKGHNYVMSFIIHKKHRLKDIDKKTIDNYQGYLLSVLYYLLPNFKYNIYYH